jgi:hypothetical protein
MFMIFRFSLLLLIFPSLLFGGQALTLVQINGIPSQVAATEMLRVAYSKIGIAIKTTKYPGKRALQESSQGRVDGEVFRIHKIGEIYPSLIRVPAPFYTDNTIAFSNGKSFKVNSGDDLKNYSVSIIEE